ncbi:MAG: hypothetical protein P1U88_16780 [Thalassobaculaceae bacterium]|nr:hypothetical protein [Thalassobaculaceae bacterium]
MTRAGAVPLLVLPLLLAAGSVLATVWRLPEILAEPRFWAEEARVYFAHALSAPALDALLAPHQGYYSLVPNLATWLATLVPLERAPEITTAIALTVQALPALVAALGSGPWVDTPLKRTTAVLTVLLVGAAGELHATTICSQFHLAVLAAVIYLDTETPPLPLRQTTYGLLLILCGLTGVQAIMLLPLFAWRWWLWGRRFDTFALAILTASLAVQSTAVMIAPGEIDRFGLGDDVAGSLANAAEGLVKGLLIYPVAGDLGPKTLEQPLGPVVFAISALGVISAVVAQLVLLRYGPWRPLILAAWCVAILSFAAFRRMAGGERYLELSSVLIVIAIARLAFDAGRHRAVRGIAVTALACALLVNAWLYLPRLSGVYDPSWPVWSKEIARWRAGDLPEPRIHPQWGGVAWTVTLPEAVK